MPAFLMVRMRRVWSFLGCFVYSESMYFVHLVISIIFLFGAAVAAQPQSPHFREASDAIANDDLLSFKSLIESYPSLATEHDSNVRSTLLHIAASQGSDDICRYLLRKHADVNAHDSVGGTPLEAAVFNDRLNVARILLDAGADVHSGRTPNNSFFLSILTRDTALVQLLLDHGGSAVMPDASGMLPIHVAATSSSIDVMNVLLRAGADICGGRSDSCKTAWWAALDSSVAKMDFVRSLGADINYSSGPGETVLGQALLFEHWNVARYLVARGARVTYADDPIPPLCRIASNLDDTSYISYFVKHGASVNSVSKVTKYSPLMSAIVNKHTNVALWLIAHGADTAMTNASGESPLFLAQHFGLEDVRQALLARQR
jgi:ankyrin repeat protein